MTKRILALEEVDWNRWDLSLPRYTSYPTAPHFVPFSESMMQTAMESLQRSHKPLSIYIHIPFCRSMCLFCGCAVVLNRRPERQRAYVELLRKEIELWSNLLERRNLVQIHWGGGTPTSLEEAEFALLLQALEEAFCCTSEMEMSIEIDPRTVIADQGKKLRFLKRAGVTRVSFGVQDLDPRVQEAVRRRQSREMTYQTYAWARELGFRGVHMDLIYGLPLQTQESFSRTIEDIAALRPDRIALFSYAHVPWLKEHQKAIRTADLPSAGSKWAMYLQARDYLLRAGYVAIGMDHFAVPEDALVQAYCTDTMTRNFQGYAPVYAETLVGLGVTAIGESVNCYMQNAKTLEAYQTCLDAGRLPIARGVILNDDDVKRRFVIQSLMCRYEVQKKLFQNQFNVAFDLYFSLEREVLFELEQEGLLVLDEEHVRATEVGQILIRRIAAAFDRYLPSSTVRYSRL